MRKILLIISISFIINTVFGQTNFEDKVDIYTDTLLSTNIIYDDFDNDGDLDLIKHVQYSPKNVLLQKNENGDFNSKRPTIVANGVNPIVALDLNNDNFPDIITYNYSDDTIGILYNLQDDSFSEEEIIMSFSGSYYIHPIKFDYNLDGYIDLIVIDDADDVHVLLNDQEGGLEAPQYILPLNSSFDSIYKIDDFDNDGDFDFYIQESNYLKIYLNNSGDFNQPNILRIQSYFDSHAVLDVDGNGYKDILYWKTGGFWVKYFDYNESDEEFVVLDDILAVDNIPFYTPSNNDNALYIESEDSTGIHTVYVALETSDNHDNIYKFNIDNGVFGEPQLVLSNFEINIFNLRKFNFSDIDNDGNLDFSFTSDFNQQRMILMNYDINNSSDKTICIQQSVFPSTLSVADMDGDGIEDVCMGIQNGLSYIKKTANGEPNNLQNLIGVMSNSNASTYTLNHIIDFDNDGLGDVIDFDNSGGYAKVYRNLGADSFEYIQSVSVTSSKNIHFADIDSDGFLDMVFGNLDSASNVFNWSKNNNGNNFESPQPMIIDYSGSLSVISLAFDDFNNDNQTDMLLLNSYYVYGNLHKNIVLCENDNGQFTANSIVSMENNYYSKIKINDFDQDGDKDFFVYNGTSNRAFILYQNDGLNNFDEIIIDSNNNIEDIEFDDNDGDGINEIYAWNYDGDSYLNNIFYYTTTDYSNYVRIGIDTFPSSGEPFTDEKGDLILFDYDYDNKKDLFFSDFFTPSSLVSVYKNISIGLNITEIDNNLSHLKLYPNPFVTSIYWDSKDMNNYTIKLLTLNGKLINEITVSDCSIDLSSLDDGVYLLVIKDENLNQKWNYKIIKNNDNK